jgi:nitrogen regulatory protein PII
MYAVMFVLDDPGKLDQLLDAWEKAGIQGVTIIESTGFQRRRAQRKHLPLRFDFQPIIVGTEKGNMTLYTFVDSQELIDACIQATEGVVGNLDDPNTGVLVSWPLSIVRGIPKNRAQKDGDV